MSVDAERILKISRCYSVKFHGKDKHGDTIFVDIEGDTAKQILKFLKMGIENKDPIIFTKEVVKNE